MQRVAVDLHRALTVREDIELLTLCLESDARWTGPRTFGFIVRLLREVPRLVHDQAVDVVLFSSMVTASIVAVLGKRIRDAGAITAAIPVGRDITLDNPPYQWFVKRVLRELDVILPISRATAETALVRGADPRRVHVVPCGVDLPELSAPDDRGAERDALLARLRATGPSVREDALLLLSVGRHQKRKGFLWFVEEVMPRLGEETVYLLAGNGPMTGAIEKAIRGRGLERRVMLLGKVPEDLLVALYRGSDLFIMPNIPVPGDIEGFGVVMIEAGAAGLPVIAADLEGIRDVVTPGVNGSLVPPGDSDGFAREVERYADPILRIEESRRAERHVRGSFGWQGIAEKHLTILRRELASAREYTDSAPEDRTEPSEDLADDPQKNATQNISEHHAATPGEGLN